MATAQELQQITREMTAAMRTMMDRHQTFLTDLHNGERGKRRGKPGESPSASLNINRRVTQSLNNMNKHIEKSSALFSDLNDALKDTANNIRQNARSGQQSDVLIRAQRINMVRAQRELAKQSKTLEGILDKLTESLERNSNANDDAAESAGFLSNAFKKLGTAIPSGWMAAGFKNMIDEVQYAMSRSSVYNVDTQVDAVTMGMTGKELLELQAEYRADMLRSEGGIRQWTDSLKESQLDLFAFTGSLHEANKANAAIRSNLTSVGLTFDEVTAVIGKGNTGLIGDLKSLSTTTGKTISEINEVMKSVISSDESRAMLMKMTKDQRVGYVLTQGNLIKQFQNLTGSLDKAQSMVLALQDRGNKSMVDRFREAVKLQTAASYAGMSNADAKRLGELARINPAQLSEGQKEEFRRLGGTLSHLTNQMAGSGDLSQEHVANMLRDRLGASAMDVFNTDTYQGIKENAAEEHRRKSLSNAIDTNDTVKDILTSVNQIHALLRNALVMLGVGALGKLMTGGKGFGEMLTRNADRIRNGGTGRIRTTLGNGLQGAANMGAKYGPRMLRGGLIGAVGVGSSMAVDHLWDADSEISERNKNATSRALEYAGYGAALGMLAGPIGAAVGGAVGGLTGAIVGLSELAKKQEQYDAEAAIADAENRKESLSVLQNQLTSEFNAASESLTAELAAAGTEAQRIELREKLSNLSEEHTQRMSDIMKQSEALDKLAAAQTALANDLEEQLNFTEGFDSAFESFLGLDKEVDTEKLLDATNMTAAQLLSDMATTLGPGAMSSTQMSEMLKRFKNGADIDKSEDGELYDLMMQYRDTKLKNLGSDVANSTIVADAIETKHEANLKPIKSSYDLEASVPDQKSTRTSSEKGSTSESVGGIVGSDERTDYVKADPELLAVMERLGLTMEEFKEQQRRNDREREERQKNEMENLRREQQMGRETSMFHGMRVW